MSLQRVAFSPLHTFTRATNETFFNRVVDSFGNVSYELQTAPSGTAVQNAYDPATGEPLGLQVFEQRTNLLRYSEDFGNAVWAKAVGGTASAPVVTVNAGVAPDGTTTADRIQFALNGGTSSGDRSDVTQSVTVPSLATTSRSVYIKSNTSQSYDLVFGSNAPTSTTTKITVTPEWQRFDLNHTADATSSNIYFGLRNASGVTGVSDSADVLVWGAQLEVGAFPTPYIKTEATTATRNASVAVINDIDESEWWNPSEGTFVVEFKTNKKDNAFRLLSFANNLSLLISSINELNIDNRAAGGGITKFLPVISFTNNTNYRLAVSVGAGMAKASLSGSPISTAEVADNLLSLATDFYIGSNVGSSGFLDGNCKIIKYYPTAVSDAKLQELSAL
jgi:hypothetical protein